MSVVFSIAAFILSIIGALFEEPLIQVSSCLILISLHLCFLRNGRLFSSFNFFCFIFWGMNLIHLLNMEEASKLYYSVSTISIAIFYLVNSKFVTNNTSFSQDVMNVQEMRLRFNTSNSHFYIFIFLLCLGMIFRVLDLGGSIFSETHSRIDIKDSGGILSIISNYLMIFTIPFYFFIPFYNRRKIKYYFILFLALLLLFLTFFILRTRSVVFANLICFISGLMYITFSGRKISEATRIPKRLLIIGLTSILLIIVSASFLRVARGAMEVGGIENVKVSESLQNSLVNGDMNYGKNIDEIISKFDNENVFLNGQSYYRLLLTPLPRAIWPEKPENTQQIVAETMGKSYKNYTLPPGVQGDAYINFGYFGFIVFFFFAYVASRLDRSMTLKSSIFMPCLFLPIFHLVRGGFTNPLIMASVIYIACSFLVYFFVSEKSVAE